MAKKKILVVDNEPDILKIVTFRLGKMGYEVLTAADGQEGLDLIREKKPNLVLLDLRLPVLDGNEVCKQVKSDEKLKKIPIILLTATDSIGKNAEKAKELGANDYMMKPFDLDKLVEKIKKYIK
jgi:two-component system alkaline phosphatase synthesis response regulator PhoP